MSIQNELKELIDHYFNCYPNMSINALSKRSNVPATTLRRIKDGKTKSEPAPHTVLNLMSALFREKTLANIIKKSSGEIRQLLEKNFSLFAQEESDHEFNVILNKALEDEMGYNIYKLAANRIGISLAKIQDLFGARGEKALADLREKGLLECKKENGLDVFHAKKKKFSIDLETAVNHLPHLLTYYKPKHVDRGQNIFYSFSEALSEEGIQKIKEIQKEAITKIYHVMESPFYSGHIHYFSVNLADTMEYGS